MVLLRLKVFKMIKKLPSKTRVKKIFLKNLFNSITHSVSQAINIMSTVFTLEYVRTVILGLIRTDIS